MTPPASLVASVAAVLLAGASGRLAFEDSRARLRSVVPPSRQRALGGGPSRLVLLGAAVLAAVVAAPGPTCAAGMVATALLVHRRRSTARRVVEKRRRAVLDATLALSAALTAGLSSAAAWRQAALSGDGTASTLLAGVVRDPGLGAEVTVALREAARQPGAEGLRRVLACWEVAAGAGAGLGLALDQVADGLRREDALRRQVAAELAAPRATARVLAVLPVVGVALGASVGADPLFVLLRTSSGQGCLAAGTALSALGLVWVERIAASAQPLR